MSVTWNPNLEHWSRIENGVSIYHREGVCLSGDTKPTIGVENGSILKEMDTSTIHHFDKDNGIWRQWGGEDSGS